MYEYVIWAPALTGHNPLYIQAFINSILASTPKSSTSTILLCLPRDSQASASRLFPALPIVYTDVSSSLSSSFNQQIQSYRALLKVLNDIPALKMVYLTYPDCIWLALTLSWLTHADPKYTTIGFWMRLTQSHRPYHKMLYHTLRILLLHVLSSSHRFLFFTADLSYSLAPNTPLNLPRITYHPELIANFSNLQVTGLPPCIGPYVLCFGAIGKRKNLHSLLSLIDDPLFHYKIVVAGQIQDESTKQLLSDFSSSPSLIVEDAFISNNRLKTLLTYCSIVWCYQPGHLGPSATLATALSFGKSTITSTLGHTGRLSSLSPLCISFDKFIASSFQVSHETAGLSHTAIPQLYSYSFNPLKSSA